MLQEVFSNILWFYSYSLFIPLGWSFGARKDIRNEKIVKQLGKRMFEAVCGEDPVSLSHVGNFLVRLTKEEDAGRIVKR